MSLPPVSASQHTRRNPTKITTPISMTNEERYITNNITVINDPHGAVRTHNTYRRGMTSNTYRRGMTSNTYRSGMTSNTYGGGTTSNTYGGGTTSNTYGPVGSPNTGELLDYSFAPGPSPSRHFVLNVMEENAKLRERLKDEITAKDRAFEKVAVYEKQAANDSQTIRNMAEELRRAYSRNDN